MRKRKGYITRNKKRNKTKRRKTRRIRNYGVSRGGVRL